MCEMTAYLYTFPPPIHPLAGETALWIGGGTDEQGSSYTELKIKLIVEPIFVESLKRLICVVPTRSSYTGTIFSSVAFDDWVKEPPIRHRRPVR